MNNRSTAANKAVLTLRQNRLSNIDRVKLAQICHEIIALEYAFEDSMDRQAIIAKNIGPTSWKSFCRFGNRSNATPGLILYWINNGKDGMPLDEQAMWMTEGFNLEFLPDELAQFMMDHDRGLSMFEPLQKIVEAKRLFKEMAGFHFNHKFVREYIIPTEDITPTEPDYF